MKKLFLVPTPISDDLSSIPSQIIKIIKENNAFICERVRTSRRFIKSIIKDYNIDIATFIELNKREELQSQNEIVQLLGSGRDVCFMSEAGSPCIADPGAEIVNMARNKGYQIVPLSGPSAIILALMSSGMNGQQFIFRGYLPVKKDGLKKELKLIEKIIFQTKYTQIFIETPYRNVQMFDQIMESLSPTLRLHLSYNIHSEQEYLETKSLKEWKKDQKVKSILGEKAPCIFILGV